eukprot:5025295-Amphidinium_carterae.2
MPQTELFHGSWSPTLCLFWRWSEGSQMVSSSWSSAVSVLLQCPVMSCAFDTSEKMMIMTANGHSLKPQKEVLLSSCGFDVEEDRFVI